jgi:hypothetical protein
MPANVGSPVEPPAWCFRRSRSRYGVDRQVSDPLCSIRGVLVGVGADSPRAQRPRFSRRQRRAVERQERKLRGWVDRANLKLHPIVKELWGKGPVTPHGPLALRDL